jgi:hypothetical protein
MRAKIFTKSLFGLRPPLATAQLRSAAERGKWLLLGCPPGAAEATQTQCVSSPRVWRRFSTPQTMALSHTAWPATKQGPKLANAH